MTTTTQKPATTKPLKLRQYLGYAAGDSGNNLAFSMASMFLLLYYTDVVGIPAAYAAPIFLIVRIWDGIGDLIVGRWVDRTRSKWGKFRPWILFSSLPLLLASVWVFSLPDADSLTMKLFWAYLSYSVLAMLYSMVNIPYGSLAATMTQKPVERAKLATFRSLGAAATVIMLSFVVAPLVERWSADNRYNEQVEALGGSESATQVQLDAARSAAAAEAATGLQNSLTTITLIFVGVGFLLYMFTFLTAKEQVSRPVKDKTTFREAMRTLGTNKPLLWLCASSIVMLTALITMQTVGIYYARDVLGSAGYYTVITVLNTGAIFLVAPFIARIVARFGKKNGYLAGGVIMAFGSSVLIWAPTETPYFAYAGFLIMGLGFGLVNTLMWALEADTIEYGEWKTGRRTEGTTYAVFSFVRKLGQAFGGFAAATVIGVTGYVGSAVTQTPEAVQGIKLAAGLVPAALGLLAVIIMLKYPLTDKRFAEMVGETADRRAGENEW